MKKFGFGKKEKSGTDEDAARSSLFSRSSKNNSPAPSSQNPYAQPPSAPDPYADSNKYAMPANSSPYQQAKAGLPSGPRAGGLPSGPRGGAAPPQNGFGQEKYGTSGGYGQSRYDTKPDTDSGSRYGPGGYGGLGRRNSNETTTTEDNRNALFGDAKQRYEIEPRPAPGYAADSGTSGAGSGYGTYGEGRELTAEEAEEEDVQAAIDQIKFMKQEDVSSTRNALRIAAQAEETGRATLARLGAQGERIHNTEKNLDLAANHNRLAEEKARELKTLNKSMFAVHVSNPFTKTSRIRQRDEEIINKHRLEREQRDETRATAFQSQQRMEQSFKDIDGGEGYRPRPTQASLAERSKYQFEADSDDDRMEDEIDANLDALGGAASRLNALARATGKEVDSQNKIIDGIVVKTDRVDDQIAMNRARLDRIH